MSAQSGPAGPSEGLRERKVAQDIREEDASTANSDLDTPQESDDVEKEQKTFGRTPSGTSMFEQWQSGN